MQDGQLIGLAEKGWLPDFTIRMGIRRLLRSRLEQINDYGDSAVDFARRMRSAPMVSAAAETNAQHYEVPAEFFRYVLGRRLKYSCGLWSNDVTLDAAEEAMLAMTCQRAEMIDGMDILELGCGWGSLSLWLAEKYPNSRIVGISNSKSQRAFIEQRAAELSLQNLQILTRNISAFETSWRFDRVVSVEMFEHVRNHAELLRRIARWLTPAGKLFVHIFCHKETPYTFDESSSADWMARHFFTGGMMPSAELFGQYGEHLAVRDQWQVNGQHYSRTCVAWLARLDAQRELLLELLASDSDRSTAQLRLQRWRIFFMACSELFAYRGGTEWFVSHYLFEHARQFANSV